MKRLYTFMLNSALALAVIAAPLALDTFGHSELGSAHAARGGNGGGNGNGPGGGGNGPGNNGRGNAFGHAGRDADGGEGAGNGVGHGNNLGNSHGKIASALGRLNAAHASANARAHAAPNSAVGRIAAYEEAARINAAVTTLNDPEATQEQIDAARAALVELGVDPDNPPTPEEAATAEVEALAAAANKSIAPLGPDDDQDANTVSDAIQSQVNALLGLDTQQ